MCEAYYGWSCYILVLDTLDAAGARSRCLQYGGHLAVVDDATENGLIHQIAEGQPDIAVSYAGFNVS